MPDGQDFTSNLPFSTAFERNGRFLWEFRSSSTPGGKPNNQYLVWSKDQKQFDSYWTLGPARSRYADIGMAMAGPTGISGGSATVVIPLLRKDMNWGLRTTDLVQTAEKPPEKVDGVSCTVITGKETLRRSAKGSVTLWIDENLAIRKVVHVEEIDPAEIDGPKVNRAKFSVTTTITLSPCWMGRSMTKRLNRLLRPLRPK